MKSTLVLEWTDKEVEAIADYLNVKPHEVTEQSLNEFVVDFYSQGSEDFWSAFDTRQDEVTHD